MLFLVLISIIIIALQFTEYKWYSTWSIVVLITDPGGVVNKYFGKGLETGGFYFIDFFFLLSFVVLLIGNFKLMDFFKNRLAKVIFYTLLLFSLYKMIFWGFLVPGVTISEFFRFCLVRERDSIYGFIFIIPVYLFAVKELRTFCNLTILLSAFILFLSLVSIVFGLTLIDITAGERYQGSGIVRYFLSNYGLLTFVIPASIAVYLSRIKIRNRSILFWGGFLGILNILATLTKGLYLNLVAYIISATFLTNKILNTNRFSYFTRILIFVTVGYVFLSVSLPKYSSYSFRIFQDIFLLASTGEMTDGSTSRMWQIPALTYEISQNPIFGTGQGFKQLSQKFDDDQFDATDLSLLAHIMQYGFLGIFIYLGYFYQVFKLIRLNYQKFRTVDTYVLLRIFKYEIVVAIASISFFAGYFFRVQDIFMELTRGGDRILMSIYTALLLACLQRINDKMTKETRH